VKLNDETVSSEVLVERAAALVPLLREQAKEVERRGRLTDAVVSAVRAARLLDLFKPRRYGGLEVSLRTATSVQAELGRGCSSTAWVVSQLNGSSIIACLFPERVREEIFARPDASVAFSLLLSPGVSAERAPGGYTLTGAWPFCTGCHHASWIGVAAPLPGEDGEDGEDGAESGPREGSGGLPRIGLFLLPASQMTIKDDWHVSGLNGTGSNTVAATGAFVPERHVLDFTPTLREDFVLEGLDSPIYRMPFFVGLLLNGASSALGMAQSALEEFKAQLPGRAISYTLYNARAEAAMTHIQIAEAAMKLDAARLLLYRGVDDVEGHAVRRETMGQQGRLRARMDAAFAATLCREAIEILFDASGASSLSLSNRIQRVARDARALCQHGAFSLRPALEAYGRSLLGLPTNASVV
jgi:alkylation response protein AidB-like acyl-CoA dehydrogenase